MLITISCLSFSSVLVLSVRGQLKSSVDAEFFPVVCFLRKSNFSSIPSYLVLRALFFWYARLCLVKSSKAWWSAYRIPILLYKWKIIFSSPYTTADSFRSLIECFFTAFVKYLLVKSIGQIVLSFCLYRNDFRVRFGLRWLLLYHLGFWQSVMEMILLLSFLQFINFLHFYSVRFHSEFFFISWFIRFVFSESSGKSFAIYCIAPRKNFSSLLDVDGFDCEMPLIFFCPGLIRSRWFHVPSNLLVW